MVSPGIAVTTTGTEVAGGSRRPLRISATEAFQSRLGLQFVAPSVGRDSGEIVAGGCSGAATGAVATTVGVWLGAWLGPPRRTSLTCASHCCRADGGSEAESLLEPAHARSVCLSMGESGRGCEGPCASSPTRAAGGEVATRRRWSNGSSTGEGGSDGGVALFAGLAVAPDCRPRSPSRSPARCRPSVTSWALLEDASLGHIAPRGGLGARQLTHQRETRLGPSVRGLKGLWHAQQSAYFGPPSARRLPGPLPSWRAPIAPEADVDAASTS